ncbi:MULTISPECIES: trans-sulfuration enzyme family protein [Paracoccus]|uniref:trans-sulfuration enzyme family protein n=1 Tax=Paracoccus TaxID=265 RepID=UPI000FDCA494|nr:MULTISPECIES: aminotransferase class I/II-fold pyridoxal phosphate-dependent enzyme [Paracoccus]AZY95035.1 aminotransferase class I/II-fold pyridoxal phosphate-dependent enzyme [Paracoccus sp. Arc7-R13]TNC00219.1 aminotransferase class I/II-fold pyridoxal phosphate-dependent enzyme [Paracoccus marcusii]
MRDATLCPIHPAVCEEGYASLTVPTHRASTIVFQDAAAYASRGQRSLDGYSYGLHGTPTNRVLEAQLSRLEGAQHSVLLPSGQTAIAVCFLATLRPGDTVLVPDSAYPPVMGFCRNFLAPLGINHRIYRPDAADLEAQINDSVRLIWMESPGSTTMEVQDVPAIVALAKKHGILTGIDNTWATPLLFKPLAYGVDFSMQALTKYVGGHSDLLMGSVSVANAALHRALRDQMRMLGLGVPADAVALALRGIETMAVRMAHQGRIALDIARDLSTRDIGEVLHPALPGSPGHALWARDFTGSSGVFSVVLDDATRLDEALNALRVFAIGASWGGTRSLMAPMTITRDNPHPRNDKTILRLQIGLEDPADLSADLAAFFDILTNKKGA